MTAETEAECLLRSGTLYRLRSGLISPGEGLAFVGLKRGAFSVYEGDEPIYHFDLEGRWQRAYIDGIHYRKALDGTVDAIDRPRVEGSMVISRRRLNFAETADLDESIRQVALKWLERLGSESLSVVEPNGAKSLDPPSLRELFTRAARWESAAWFAQRERYLATYSPLDFLPPDDHQSVVLQATVGDQAFSPRPDASAPRTTDEFRVHCRQLKTFLGRRLAQNRDVYLGGSSAVRGPIERYFEVANEELPIVGRRDGSRVLAPAEAELGYINLFLDDFRSGLPDTGVWQRLKDHHLGRVNLGVVTADNELRRTLGLGGSAEDVAEVVRCIKSAAIDVAVFFHLGIGDQEHVARTVQWVEALDFSREDFLYLIDGEECGLRMNANANRKESDAQREIFKERLTPLRKKNGVKVVPYSIEKQWN